MFAVGLMEGALIGGAVAHRREVRRERDMLLAANLAAQQTAICNANANAELARAEAAALRRQQPAAQTAGVVAVSVVVPAGVRPGAPFQVASGGHVYMVTCPAGVLPGQALLVELPAVPVVAVAY